MRSNRHHIQRRSTFPRLFAYLRVRPTPSTGSGRRLLRFPSSLLPPHCAPLDHLPRFHPTPPFPFLLTFSPQACPPFNFLLPPSSGSQATLPPP